MFRKTFSAFTLVAALAAPALVPAVANAQVGVDLRFYDSSHKDYHHWDHDEDVRYRAYLNDHHRSYREFNHLNKKQQQEYWKWRHENERR